MPAAFVTGGSGFIGGALIERLRREGWGVRALARSVGAAAKVRERGAEPVAGELGDMRALEAESVGCDVCFHAAAKVEDWGDPAEFERLNVGGTANVIAACRAAGVRRLVHVGTEAALTAGQALVGVDERAPLRPDSPFLYSSSKAKAEQLVREANGEPVVFREFLERMLATQGVSVPDKSVPAGAAGAAAAGAELAWRLLRRPGPPPLTRFAVWVSSKECTLDISRARTELGYEPVRTRDEGLAGLVAPGNG